MGLEPFTWNDKVLSHIYILEGTRNIKEQGYGGAWEKVKVLKPMGEGECFYAFEMARPGQGPRSVAVCGDSFVLIFCDLGGFGIVGCFWERRC